MNALLLFTQMYIITVTIYANALGYSCWPKITIHF